MHSVFGWHGYALHQKNLGAGFHVFPQISFYSQSKFHSHTLWVPFSAGRFNCPMFVWATWFQAFPASLHVALVLCWGKGAWSPFCLFQGCGGYCSCALFSTNLHMECLFAWALRWPAESFLSALSCCWLSSAASSEPFSPFQLTNSYTHIHSTQTHLL